MKLAAEKDLPACTNGYGAMLRTDFAAPVLRGRPVVLVVNDECRRVQLVPPIFQGWAVARLISPTIALVVREADAVERQMLLRQWLTVSLQICHIGSASVLAVSLFAETSSAVIRLHLCDEAVAVNDVVLARFDGRQYWFDRIVARNCEDVSIALRSPALPAPDLCAVTFATHLATNSDRIH
jgi:hypothetical protein